MTTETQDTAVTEDITSETEVESTEQNAEETKTEPTLAELREALAAEKTAREQIELRLKSTQGQLRVKLDLDAELKALRRGQTSVNARLEALAKGQIAGDPAVTERELAAAQRNSQDQELQESFAAQGQELLQGIQEEAEDSGLGLDTAPEFAEVRDLWNEGLRTQNLTMMRKAERAAKEVRRNVQTAAWEKEQAEEKKKSGALRTPNLRASGSGGNSYISKLKSGDSLPPSEEIDRLTARYLNK